MLEALRRFVDIRPGERRTVLLAAAILFAMVGGHMMLETARDALFLEELPARRLPWVYAALAGLTLVAIAASDRLVRFAGRRNALVGTLTVAVYGTVFFYLLPRGGAVVFSLYLWSGLIGTVVVIQFWIFAGQLFTVEQAKRLFGALAAGGALGALVGASISRVVVELVRVENLLLTGTAMFLIAAFLLTTFPADAGPVAASARGKRELSAPELLRRYPYLRRLLGLLIVATITVLTVDYMFKAAAERHVEDADLGGFFATYYTIFAAFSLLFQLVGAGFLLRRLGVLASLLVMPILVAVGGAATVALGGLLLAAVATKGVDGALRHSLHRVSTELLWMPLPSAIRARAKGILDGGLSRGVQAAAAAALLALSAIGLASPTILAGIVVGLSLIWAALAVSLRGHYLGLYRDGLARRPVDDPAELDLNSLEVLVEALSSANDREVIAAMKLLAAKGRARLIPSLILYHGSSEVLVESLRLVASDDRRDWIPIAVKLLDHDDESVRASALGALARRGELAPLAGRGPDISPRVRARWLFWKIQTAEAASDALKDPEVRELLDARGGAAAAAIRELLRAIAEDGDGRWSGAVLELLGSSDPEIEELAVSATGVLRDPRFLPVLIARLGDRRGRGAVRSALLAIGEAAQTALVEALAAEDTTVPIRLHIPRSIALFRNPQAAHFLLEHLQREPSGAVRYRGLQVLARLAVDERIRLPREPLIERLAVNLREHFRLLSLLEPLGRGTYELPPEAVESADLLRGLLEDKRHQSLGRCFLLLQIAHPREDIRGIEAAVAGGDRRTRANGLEFVDNLTIGYRRHARGAEVHELLRLALDDLPIPAKLERAGPTVSSRTLTYDQAVLALAKDEDETTAAIATYHALLLDVPHLRAEVAIMCRARPLIEKVGPELQRLITGESNA